MFRCAKASPFFPRRFLDSLLFLVFDPNPLAPPLPTPKTSGGGGRKKEKKRGEKRRNNVGHWGRFGIGKTMNSFDIPDDFFLLRVLLHLL